MDVRIGQPSEVDEYDREMQDLLQMLWGDGFLSPGGSDEVDRVLEGSDISGGRVLDIGAALGAIDVLLVQRHGAGSVVGIDVDPGLLAQAESRIARNGLTDRIRTQCIVPGALPFRDESFDVVFSKDSIVQIPGKAALYAEIIRVLRPGGRFIASDWLRGGERAFSPDMLEFIRLAGVAYNLISLQECATLLRSVGFTDIEVRDRNAWYRDLARRELTAMEGDLRDNIVERIGVEGARDWLATWRQMVRVLEWGELRPGHVKAHKPD
jgi:phosphoethanolamine N-methyltransferase